MSIRFLSAILVGSIMSGACGTPASDPATSLDPNTAATPATSPPPRSAEAAPPPPARPVVLDVTIPEGTALTLRLTSAVASDTSRVEDPVSAELTNPVTVDGRTVLPAGSNVAGVITAADGAGRVKGRASVAFRFNSLRAAGEQYDINTAVVSRVAPATKSEDATKIGIGAGAGAAIGAILGGKKGAAEGAAVGGGAGTGVVLATKGSEVRLAAGERVTTQLTAPLTVRVSARN